MPTPKKYADEAAKYRAYRERKKSALAAAREEKGLPPQPVIATMPGTSRWRAMLESTRAQLVTLRDEMQSYSDERSQSWQESDRGQEFSEQIEEIEEILSSVEEIEL
jgi:hypothetical protein